jgi:hypothetical protein
MTLQPTIAASNQDKLSRQEESASDKQTEETFWRSLQWPELSQIRPIKSSKLEK